MQKFDLTKKRKVYFIGIGGISMSAIAYILLQNGFIVLGSDNQEKNEEVIKLKSMGVKVNIGHKYENITKDIDIVVYSKAIHDDNPEMIAAKDLGITLKSRSLILGEIMLNYDKRICIAGTHGKTTTTSLVSKVIFDSGIDPTINVGGIVDEFNGNTHIGNNFDTFVAEACEYTNSFLDFAPSYEIITSIDNDHLDFFKDLDDIRKSFKKYINLLPNDGILVINKCIDNIDYLLTDTNAKVITYGDDESADYYYKNQRYDKDHYQLFDVYHKNENLGEMRIKLIGRHNIWNFLGTFALLREMGFKLCEVRKSLENFTGAKRRLEVKGVINGVTYIDDYAHHPTEIEASIKALKELDYNNLFIIFQPHTYSRTKLLLDDFAKVLSNADNLLLAPIYAAREINKYNISSIDIKNKIINNQVNKNNFCEYFETFEKIREYVSCKIAPKDIVVTMGAGNINCVFSDILN